MEELPTSEVGGGDQGKETKCFEGGRRDVKTPELQDSYNSFEDMQTSSDQYKSFLNRCCLKLVLFRSLEKLVLDLHTVPEIGIITLHVTKLLIQRLV